MYAVKATVDGGDWEGWNGFYDLPEFLLDTDDKDKAEEMARKIVDPLHMTGATITVTRARGYGQPSLLARLRKAVKG